MDQIKPNLKYYHLLALDLLLLSRRNKAKKAQVKFRVI